MPRGLTDQMEPMPNEVRELRTALAFREQARAQWQLRAEKAEADLADIRSILAATDIGSLPHDYQTRTMAADRMERIKELTLEGLGIIGRAEKAEAEVARLRAALESIAANTCCDRCQEAALVARDALAHKGGEDTPECHSVE